MIDYDNLKVLIETKSQTGELQDLLEVENLIKEHDLGIYFLNSKNYNDCFMKANKGKTIYVRKIRKQ